MLTGHSREVLRLPLLLYFNYESSVTICRWPQIIDHYATVQAAYQDITTDTTYDCSLPAHGTLCTTQGAEKLRALKAGVLL